MALLIIQSEGKEWTFTLVGEGTTVGRSSQCTLCIKDNSLSREHCFFKQDGDAWIVEDRGSKNGTLVNGARVPRTELTPGDKIQIGATVLYFEEKPQTKRRSRPEPESAAVSAPQKDFIYRGRSSAGKNLVLWGVGSIAVIVLAAFLITRVLFRPDPVETDPDNLLSANSSFERTGPNGTVEGWSLAAPTKSTMAADTFQPRHRKHALRIDKSEEFLVECGYDQLLDVASWNTLNAQVWYRCDSAFRGYFAIKIGWYRRNSPLPMLEEVSDVTLVTENWKEVACTFVAPVGAEQARLSFIAFGRAGRLFVDQARLVGSQADSRRKGKEFQEYRLTVGRNGTAIIALKGREAVLHAGLVLANEDGVMVQELGQVTRISDETSGVKIDGIVFHPTTLEKITYEQRWTYEEGSLNLQYRIPKAAAKVFQSYGVHLSLPFPTDMVTTASSPTEPLQVSYRLSRELQVLLLSPGHMKLEKSDQGHDVRLLIRDDIPVTLLRDKEEFLTFTLTVRESDLTRLETIDDILKSAKKADKERKYGAALQLYERLLAKVTDRNVIADLQQRIREIRALEEGQWEGVSQKASEAELSQRQDIVSEALSLLQDYRQTFQEIARPESESLEPKLKALASMSAHGEDHDRARRLFSQAEQYVTQGQKELAMAYLDILIKYYSSSPEAQKAGELLGSLK